MSEAVVKVEGNDACVVVQVTLSSSSDPPELLPNLSNPALLYMVAVSL